MTDYRMRHRPGSPEYGAPAHALDQIYPEDVYSPQGLHYYGTGYKEMDRKTHALLRGLRGRPNSPITIYRAVPHDAPDEIQPGDWVTPTREYAQQHGESTLEGKHKILQKVVPAGHIYTTADSWHEFGYHPPQDA